jgi:hypothetical protein
VVLYCINAALRCVDPKNLIRYKDFERPSHRGVDYFGSWEDIKTGVEICFKTLPVGFSKMCICLWSSYYCTNQDGHVSSEDIYIYITRFFSLFQEYSEGSEHFLLEVDSKYTEETYDKIFEQLILIEPVMRTFLSEEYISDQMSHCAICTLLQFNSTSFI